MKNQAYGVSRSRDRKGKIVHQELKPYTMCIHTFVGGGLSVNGCIGSGGCKI